MLAGFKGKGNANYFSPQPIKEKKIEFERESEIDEYFEPKID